MVATSRARVGSTRSVVAVSLTVGTGSARHCIDRSWYVIISIEDNDLYLWRLDFFLMTS